MRGQRTRGTAVGGRVWRTLGWVAMVLMVGGVVGSPAKAQERPLSVRGAGLFDGFSESARSRSGPENIQAHGAWGRNPGLDCLERSRQEAAAETRQPGTRTFEVELSGEPHHAPFVPHGNRKVTGQATVTFHTDVNTMTWDIRLVGNEFEVTQAHFYNVNPASEFYEPTGASVFCWGGRWSDHEFLSGQGFPVDPAHIDHIIAHPDDWMLILHTEGGHFANDGGGLVVFDPTVHNTNEIGVDETGMERWFNNRIGKRLGDFTLREPNPHFPAGDRFFEERFGPDYFSRQHDRPFPDAQGNVWLELGEDGEWRLTPAASAAGYDLQTEYLYFRYSDDGPSWDWGGSEGAFGGRLRVEPKE